MMIARVFKPFFCIALVSFRTRRSGGGSMWPAACGQDELRGLSGQPYSCDGAMVRRSAAPERPNRIPMKADSRHSTNVTATAHVLRFSWRTRLTIAGARMTTWFFSTIPSPEMSWSASSPIFSKAHTGGDAHCSSLILNASWKPRVPLRCWTTRNHWCVCFHIPPGDKPFMYSACGN